jgi:threonine aldolase
MDFKDFRSDTVTLPTEEMLEAIRSAQLGDDVYGEDPTVNRLQEIAAQKTGMDSALLVTSGTQGNLVSLLSHTKRGDEIIVEANSHIYEYEVGGLAAIGGLMAKPIKGTMGVMNPVDVEKEIRFVDIHQPETTLLCIENTHNSAGGTIVSPSQMEKLSQVAKKHDLSVHIDGARIFNAAVALGISVKEFTGHADSITFCLSKGLGCPVGAIVAGGVDFVEKARKWRKMLGGGMRQAGIIAAPGIIALEKMIPSLTKDHANARLLAGTISRMEGISVNLETVQTNIMMFDVAKTGATASEFTCRLEALGVKCLPFGDTCIRAVTHRGIEKCDVEYAATSIGAVASAILRGKKNSN